MAERRMFSKRVVSSGRFLKMPPSSQMLYFHLCINADDDGVVEAFGVMRSAGATEDDLKILCAKQFTYILDADDLIVYITDWRENNKIRSDRKTDSVYKDLLAKALPDVTVQEKAQRADRVGRDCEPTEGEALACDGCPELSVTPSVGRPMDGEWTAQDRLGKDRLGKDRLGKDRLGKDRLGKDRLGKGEGGDAPEQGGKHPAPSAAHIPYSQIVEAYNDTCVSLPRCKSISEARKKAIRARLSAGYTIDDFKTVFEKAEASEFLRGGNRRNWAANFDWLIADSNIAKVLDGNYDNRATHEQGRAGPPGGTTNQFVALLESGVLSG